MGVLLLANRAATRAHSSVDAMHSPSVTQSATPPMAKWLSEPVRAVKVMINTLVPTAVFSSYPRMLVNASSIIMPPPAPIKPQINPTIIPQSTDCTICFFLDTPSIAALVVMTGLTINFTPSSSVMKTEKFPIAADGTMLDTQLPTSVKSSTVTIITSPLRTSRFLFFPYVYADTALASTSLARAIPTA